MTGSRMINRLVLLGATGDLARRYVLPAVAALHAARKLPDRFAVIAAGRTPIDDETFRRSVVGHLDKHAAAIPAASRDATVEVMRYRQVDLADPESVGAVVADAASDDPRAPIAVYLALPPGLFAPTVRTLCGARLPVGSRVVVEKPFGEDLASAVALNRLLHELSRRIGETGPFRVDHFLGLASVQNLLEMRLDGTFGDVWNNTHVDEIQVVWEETLGLEGRAAYYDQAGQLRDMIQNHLLQVLCLLTMELPAALRDPQLRDAKVALMNSVLPPPRGDMSEFTRRGRYTAGRIAGRELPSYVDEPGVQPERATETFAEVTFTIDNERWSGTRFVVRTGKALSRPRMEVVVRFRAVPGNAPGVGPATPLNELHLGLSDDGALILSLDSELTTGEASAVPIAAGRPPEPALPPYGMVLLDVLSGDSVLSVSAEEAEQAWRIVEPVLEAWDNNEVPLLEYPAGSTGPS